MVRAVSRRRPAIVAGAWLAASLMAAPVAAQSTGMVKGKVTDAQGAPVEGAKVTIEFQEGVTRRHETKTNKRGEFIQIGLFPGQYKVTADKEKLGSQSFPVRVRLGQVAEVNFQLVPGQAGPSKEDIAKGEALNEALKKTFEEGVAASRAGNYDEAIAKFTEAAEIRPTCFDCYYNIGYAHAQKKAYDLAETAFKKAAELKPDYVDAYNGLANIFNAQKKFDEAAAASAKAAEIAGGGAGGANADALYNQGVIFWNAGKIAEAKKQFEEALKIDPNHAESNYQVGMALLNEGKLAEAVAAFETYVKLAPSGPNAAQAQVMIGQLKK